MNINLLSNVSNNLIKYSILLIPFFLITGPFIPDLIVSAIALIYLIKIITNKEFFYFNNKYVKYFLFFYSLCIVSSLFSDYPFYSLKTSVSYLRFLFFTLAFAIIIKKNSDFSSKLFLVLVFCFSSLLVDGYFQYFTGASLLGHEMKNVRLSSFFGDELILGSYLSRFLPLLIGLGYFYKFKDNLPFKFFFSILILLSVILIFLTGERAAFFYVIATLIFLIITCKDISKQILILGCIASLFITIFALTDQRIKKRMFDRTITQIGINKEKINIFSEMHQGHYLVAYDLFIKNKLLGVGPKNFRKHCFDNKKYEKKPYLCASHPHNTYIQLLAETGVFGFLFIFFIFGYLILKIFIHIKRKIFNKTYIFNDLQLCLICCFLISLWPFIPTGNFFNNFLSIIYFYPLAVFLTLENKNY